MAYGGAVRIVEAISDNNLVSHITVLMPKRVEGVENSGTVDHAHSGDDDREVRDWVIGLRHQVMPPLIPPG
jgi:hypothetical protein